MCKNGSCTGTSETTSQKNTSKSSGCYWFRPDWGLTIVRLTLAVIFLAHGSQKVFGWFGGSGLQGFATWLAGYGVPSWLAYVAAFAELLGGLFFLMGCSAIFGALLTIPVMIGAVTLIHWQHGFFSQNEGFEYPLSLIFFSLAILVGGPGCCTLNRLCGTKCCDL